MKVEMQDWKPKKVNPGNPCPNFHPYDHNDPSKCPPGSLDLIGLQLRYTRGSCPIGTVKSVLLKDGILTAFLSTPSWSATVNVDDLEPM